MLMRVVPRGDTWLFVVAAPVTLVCLTHGHNGFLTALLLGGGLLLLDKRPLIAGLLLGCLIYKPQFGLIIPPLAARRAALAGGRRGLRLGRAACRADVGDLGLPVWQAFVDSLPLTRTVIIEQGITGWHKIMSPFAAVRMWGGGVAAAYAVQMLATTLCIAAVAWIEWRGKRAYLRNALVCAAVLVSTPYVLDYDYVVLLPAIAFLYVDGREHLFLRWDATLLAFAWLAPFVARTARRTDADPDRPVVRDGHRFHRDAARGVGVSDQPSLPVRPGFWQRPTFLLAIALLTAVPLLLPETPPLVDLPGHLGRYRIQLDVDSSAQLQRFFEFDWRLIGNLGVDLLVVPLAPLVGLELAVKLIVLAIPPLTAAGILWMAHEVHGRVPPTALFAIPFAYSFAFNFGFINFALSIALAFLAFAWWLRLAKSRPRLRGLLFVPLSCLVWLCHAFGWGVLGVLVWGSEVAVARTRGRTAMASIVAATLRCIPVAAPLLLMALWRAGGEGAPSAGFFQFDLKLFALAAAVRDQWLVWDAFAVAVALVLLAAPAIDRRLTYAPTLAIPALLLVALFLILPNRLFGSAYADARLAPVAIMVALSALRLRSGTGAGAARMLALLGCLFVAARLAGTTASFARADSEARHELAVLDAVPIGSRVLFLVEQDCGLVWSLPRKSHFGSFVIVRRSGFANDQWDLAGSQLVRIIHDTPADFRSDPSQFFVAKRCSGAAQSSLIRYAGGGSARIRSRDAALMEFPRQAFDLVWLIGSPAAIAAPYPGLEPVRQTSGAVLLSPRPSTPHVVQAGTRLR